MVVSKKAVKGISIDQLKQEVAEKKVETKEIADANETLASENNVPVSVDPSGLLPGEKLLAALGYISFFCILPLVLKPKSTFCQFHGKQGLLLTLAFLIFGVVAKIFGLFVPIFPMLIGLVWIGLATWGLYSAFSGQITKLPLLGDAVKQLEW